MSVSNEDTNVVLREAERVGHLPVLQWLASKGCDFSAENAERQSQEPDTQAYVNAPLPVMTAKDADESLDA